MAYNVSKYWRGHPPTTDEPAASRLLRSITVASGSWTTIDLRSAAYAGATDGTAQDMSGDVRGIIRMVSVFNNDTGGTDHVDVSFYVAGGAPTPIEAYNTALSNGPAIELRCPAVREITTFYLKAVSGSPTVQLEIWYDVPPAA